MFKHGLLVSAMSALVACASQSEPLPIDKTFKVEWIGERPLIDRSHLTVRFAEDGRVSGNAGCNKWFANYQVTGEQLSLTPPAGTRKMCAESLMEQESRFLQTITLIKSWSTGEDGALNLHTQDGKSIKLFPE